MKDTSIKIVATADTHMYHRDLQDIPEGDLFIHVGDLLQAGTLSELVIASEWLRELPHKHKLFIPGNHDRCFQEQPNEAREILGRDIVLLIDAPFECGGLHFWGSPWQPAFHDWAFNLPRGKELAAKWALIPQRTDILLTHGPPFGFGDRISKSQRLGCHDLHNAVQKVQPTLHLFGHIHQDGGCWEQNGTTYANVTSWEGEQKPHVFEVQKAEEGIRIISNH